MQSYYSRISQQRSSEQFCNYGLMKMSEIIIFIKRNVFDWQSESKILIQLIWSVSDHFGTLCIKGLKQKFWYLLDLFQIVFLIVIINYSVWDLFWVIFTNTNLNIVLKTLSTHSAFAAMVNLAHSASSTADFTWMEEQLFWTI